MTLKLYWKTPYKSEFQARVKSISEKGLLLDKTLFYPQGGGQKCDKGVLFKKTKTVPVLRVIQEDKDIYHQIPIPDLNHFNVGDEIKGKIDWEYRFGLMKAHSSQHVFSAVLYNYFKISTTKVFINSEEVSIHFDKNITIEQLKAALKKVNSLEKSGILLAHGPRKQNK
ncbi:MAG: alanine--tRNA ligase-related protein [Promethearchaeota archaeon]